MSSTRSDIQRLCLLALCQLAAGPLVLVAVLAFAKVTVREAPREGLVKAISSALHSPEVQSALQALNDTSQDSSKSSLPKAAKDKVKIIAVAWEIERVSLTAFLTAEEVRGLRTWALSRPQAPPGPPPRVG